MWPKAKFGKKSQISFCKILKNKKHHVKVYLQTGFDFNGHSIEFHPQTQKLPHKTPLFTLAVKGLK